MQLTGVSHSISWCINMNKTFAVVAFVVSSLNACYADESRLLMLVANPFEGARIASPANLIGKWKAAGVDAAGVKGEFIAEFSPGPDNLILVTCTLADLDRKVSTKYDASISFHAVDNASVGLIRQGQPLDATYLPSLFQIRPYYVLQIQITDDNRLKVFVPNIPSEVSDTERKTHITNVSGVLLLTGAPQDIRQTLSKSLNSGKATNAVFELKRSMDTKSGENGSEPSSAKKNSH